MIPPKTYSQLQSDIKLILEDVIDTLIELDNMTNHQAKEAKKELLDRLMLYRHLNFKKDAI